MRHLKKTDAAIALVIVFALFSIGLAYLQLQHSPGRVPTARDLLVLGAMFVLVLALDCVQITVPRLKFRAIFSVSGTVYVAATIGYNAMIGIILTFVGLMITELVARRELRKLIFNVANHICMTGIAGVVYGAIAGPETGVPLATAHTVIAAVIAAFVYLVLNNSIFAFVVGIDIGKSPVAVFIANAPGLLMQNITLPCIGLLLTTVRDLSPLSLLIAL